MHSLRSHASCGLGLTVALIFSPAVAGQTFSKEIPVFGYGSGNSARPFGITHEPVDGRLYVALSGALGDPNDTVVEIDPATDTVVGSIQVGLYPEDVAFHYDVSTGAPLCGMATNSTDGTLSVWDAASRQVIATVALPAPFGASCYPFGVVVDDAGSLAYVGTLDGSGDVHAVDLATLLHDPLRSENVGAAGCGRMALDGDVLLVPTSALLPGFTGSTLASVGVGLQGNPDSWNTVLRAEDGVWASGQDVVVLPNGNHVVAGLDANHRLSVFAPDGELLRTFRMSETTGAQGLALDGSGELLAVCDLRGHRLTLVDVVNWEEVSVTNLLAVGRGYEEPNEAVFVGDKLYVTCQKEEAVLVFDQLPTITPGPGYAGTITVSDSTPDPGDSVTVGLSGAGVVALFTSFEDQSGSYAGVALDIGPNPRLDGWGHGSYTASFSVPPNAALLGLHAFAQGVVDATGQPRITEPRVAVVQ